MPLSEEEQRILYEIERSFYEQDPEFADRVRSESVYTHAGRHMKWAALGFVVGLIIILVTFTSSIAVAFVGVVVMFACAFLMVQNARRMGRAGLADLSASTRSKNVNGLFDDAKQRLRSRFHKGD